MRPLEIMKKRVQETREKKMRSEVELEQNERRTRELYEEAGEIAGRPVLDIEEIRKISEEKKEEAQETMRTIARTLDSAGALTPSDIETLKQEGYL